METPKQSNNIFSLLEGLRSKTLITPTVEKDVNPPENFIITGDIATQTAMQEEKKFFGLVETKSHCTLRIVLD